MYYVMGSYGMILGLLTLLFIKNPDVLKKEIKVEEPIPVIESKEEPMEEEK